jgi:hypothetical protein
MINELYRLNMEVVLTANKLRGIDPGTFHDGLAQQFEQERSSRKHRGSIILNLCKRVLRPKHHH